jgi:hypothetical protein
MLRVKLMPVIDVYRQIIDLQLLFCLDTGTYPYPTVAYLLSTYCILYCGKGMWGWGEYHILHFQLALQKAIGNPEIHSMNLRRKDKEFKDPDMGGELPVPTEPEQICILVLKLWPYFRT